MLVFCTQRNEKGSVVLLGVVTPLVDPWANLLGVASLLTVAILSDPKERSLGGAVISALATSSVSKCIHAGN